MGLETNQNVNIDFGNPNNLYNASNNNPIITTQPSVGFIPSYERYLPTETMDLSTAVEVADENVDNIVSEADAWLESQVEELNLFTSELSYEEIQATIAWYEEMIPIVEENIHYLELVKYDIEQKVSEAYLYLHKKNPREASYLLTTEEMIDEIIEQVQLYNDFKFVVGYEANAYRKTSENIILLRQTINNIETSIDSLKFQSIIQSDDYKKNYSSIQQKIIMSIQSGEKFPGGIDKYLNEEICGLLTVSEIRMLIYLKENNSAELNEYINYMQDLWNQRAAQQRVYNRIVELKRNPNTGEEKNILLQMLNVNDEGLVDGINIFFEGIVNTFTSDGKLSIGQYERMLYLAYLEKNTNILKYIYSTSSSVGNMLPTITISTLAEACCPGSGTYVGAGLMGLSSYGNTLDQTLYEGYSREIAILYSICTAGSEILLERYLGGTNGLAKYLDKKFITNLGKEGLEEALTTILQEGIIDSIILGKEINLDEIAIDTLDSLISGIIVSSYLNTYQNCLATVVYKGQRYEITREVREETEKYAKENECDISKAFLKTLDLKRVDPETRSEIDMLTNLGTYFDQDGNLKTVGIRGQVYYDSDSKKMKGKGPVKHMMEYITRYFDYTYSKDSLINILFAQKDSLIEKEREQLLPEIKTTITQIMENQTLSKEQEKIVKKILSRYKISTKQELVDILKDSPDIYNEVVDFLYSSKSTVEETYKKLKAYTEYKTSLSDIEKNIRKILDLTEEGSIEEQIEQIENSCLKCKISSQEFKSLSSLFQSFQLPIPDELLKIYSEIESNNNNQASNNNDIILSSEQYNTLFKSLLPVVEKIYSEAIKQYLDGNFIFSRKEGKIKSEYIGAPTGLAMWVKVLQGNKNPIYIECITTSGINSEMDIVFKHLQPTSGTPPTLSKLYKKAAAKVCKDETEPNIINSKMSFLYDIVSNSDTYDYNKITTELKVKIKEELKNQRGNYYVASEEHRIAINEEIDNYINNNEEKIKQNIEKIIEKNNRS